MEAALGENGQTFKVRHTSGSNLALANAREALAVVYDTADEFSQFVSGLTDQKLTEAKWQLVLDDIVGTSNVESTRTQNIRADIDSMYHSDKRVTPWTGTAFGALQAFNTWNHHSKSVRNGHRAERNMSNAINGRTAKYDTQVLKALAKAGV